MIKVNFIGARVSIAKIGSQTKIEAAVILLMSLSFCLALSLILCVSHAWADEQKSMNRLANHAFSFGGIGIPENVGIKILNFQYGDSKAVGTYVEDAWLATGHVGQGGGVTGTMPVGDFLYVKWQILKTGEVCEDRVDLKSRLPSDMDQKIIHFTIKGQQLNVYVIEGNTPANFHASGAPDCPVSSYGAFQCTRIYPDHWANF
jgi:hypothetical protein